MKFAISSGLLDACVLGVLAAEPTYGYDLTQRLGAQMDISESTLYPVLRRLMQDGNLESFDMAYDGRNRRYYKITEPGIGLLHESRAAWRQYKTMVDGFLLNKEEPA